LHFNWYPFLQKRGGGVGQQTFKSMTGTAVAGIEEVHAPRANLAATYPPRVRRPDVQVALSGAQIKRP